MVSFWELALKHEKGKLHYSPEDLFIGSRELGAQLLGLTEDHVLAVGDVVTAHADPFDRMLLAQAMSQELFLVTADATLLELNLPFVTNVRE